MTAGWTQKEPPAGSPGTLPAPPDPLDAWTAEITWRETAGGARFYVVARAADGNSPTAVAQSPALEWPPTGTASVKVLTHAVERLEALLVAAGWSVLPGGGAWYAKRFAWEPAAPELGTERHLSAPSGQRLQHVR